MRHVIQMTSWCSVAGNAIVARGLLSEAREGDDREWADRVSGCDHKGDDCTVRFQDSLLRVGVPVLRVLVLRVRLRWRMHEGELSQGISKRRKPPGCQLQRRPNSRLVDQGSAPCLFRR